MPEVISAIPKGTTTVTSVNHYDLHLSPMVRFDGGVLASSQSGSSQAYRMEISGAAITREPYNPTGTLSDDGIPTNVYRTFSYGKINNIEYMSILPNRYGPFFASYTTINLYNITAKTTVNVVTNYNPITKNSKLRADFSKTYGALIYPAATQKDLAVYSVDGSFPPYFISPLVGLGSSIYITQVFCSDNVILIGCVNGTSDPKNTTYDNRLPEFWYYIDVPVGTTKATFTPINTISLNMTTGNDGVILSYSANRVHVFDPVAKVFNTFSFAEGYGLFPKMLASQQRLTLTSDPSEIGVFVLENTTNDTSSYYMLKRIGDTFIFEFITRLISIAGGTRSSPSQASRILYRNGDDVFAVATILNRTAGDKNVRISGMKYGVLPDWMEGTGDIYPTAVVAETVPANESATVVVLNRAHGYMGG